MDEILHHFETIGRHWLVFPRESVFPEFLRCRISSTHSKTIMKPCSRTSSPQLGQPSSPFFYWGQGTSGYCGCLRNPSNAHPVKLTCFSLWFEPPSTRCDPFFCTFGSNPFVRPLRPLSDSRSWRAWVGAPRVYAPPWCERGGSARSKRWTGGGGGFSLLPTRGA